MRMLRWTYGRTMLDGIPNGVFRLVLEVGSIEEGRKCAGHGARRRGRQGGRGMSN